MGWQPGQSGNPQGRQPDRIAADSLRIAVSEVIKTGRHKGKTKLRRIGEKVAEEAIKGEPWACNLVYDRLDGKPMQVIDQAVTYQAGEVFIDLLRQISEARQGKVIEHATEDRPRTNGSVAAVRTEE